MYNRQGQGYTPGRSASNSSYNFQNQGTPAIRRQGPMNGPIGSSSRVYGGQPYGIHQQQQHGSQAKINWVRQHHQQSQQQQQQQRNYQNYDAGMNRARSTPAGIQQGIMQVQAAPGSPAGMKTYATTAGIPPEVEGNPNVQYVRMNWEDILGGKAGQNGLQVSMAPGNGDPNANRQIRIGMGGAQQADDGSTPLRIVSFQPVDNYPGLKEPTTAQPGQPKFSVYTGTPKPGGQGQLVQGQQQQQYWGNVYSNNTNNRR